MLGGRRYCHLVPIMTFLKTFIGLTSLSRGTYPKNHLEDEWLILLKYLLVSKMVAINKLKPGDCANTVYNGITITLDFISIDPNIIRIFGLRSFGESLYHSITDSSLEFGYKSV